MSENNQMMSVEGQLVGMPLAGPESFSQQQLDYLKRALGVDETVLWENTNNIPTRLLSFPQTLSENISNFKRVRISFLADGEHDSDVAPHEFEFDVTPTKDYHVYVYWNPSGTVNLFYRACFIRLNGTSMTVSRNFTYNFPNGDNNTTGYNFIMKIVGIHRISGGNE